MIRLSIIGLGNIGKVHIKNLGALRGCEIASIFDVRTDVAKALGSLHGFKVASSIEEICTDSSIDAVVVATPSESHHELVARTLSAGKHLFLEKPLAGTLEDARAISDLASQNGHLTVQVGFCERYNPQFLEMKRAVKQGQLGKLRCVQSYRTAPRGLGNPAWELGVLDTAVHNIDIILWLFEEVPVRVLAKGVKLYPGSALPDSITTMLEFPDGALAIDTVTWVDDKGHPLGQCARARMSAIGEAGIAEVDLSHRPLSVLSETTYAEIDTVIIGGPGYAGCLAAQFDAFLGSIATKLPVIASVTDAYKAERVVLAAHKSLLSSAWVELA